MLAPDLLTPRGEPVRTYREAFHLARERYSTQFMLTQSRSKALDYAAQAGVRLGLTLPQALALAALAGRCVRPGAITVVAELAGCEG